MSRDGFRGAATGQCFPQLGCGPARSLFGWSPPPLPADTRLKRWVDRLLPRTGAPALLFFGAVIALLNLAAHLPLRGALAVDGLAALAGGGWCTLNFWRCRHAHCAVTGGGWLALGAGAFAEAGLGRTFIAGDEQLVLLAILAAALVFEAVWSWARGSNALVAPRPHPGTRGTSIDSPN